MIDSCGTVQMYLQSTLTNETQNAFSTIYDLGGTSSPRKVNVM